jgi:hypothetical protein
MGNKYENDLDNQLFAAIISENIIEIENLIKKGGNINAIDEFGDNMIINYIQEKDKNSNLEIIKYMVEKNINTNYENEGFNCLFNVYLSNRDDIMEYLLKKGTCAQCISTDTCETLLDWIEWDVAYEKDDERTTMDWIKKSEKIIQLLKDYGATSAKECFTNKIEEYLKMFGGKNTGLFTKRGYINIKDLPNINEELINEFNDWKNTENIFSEKTWKREEINIEKLKECNKIGEKIIYKIKDLLPNNIKIQYYYIIPEDYKNNKNRNIMEMIINAK